MLNIRNLKVSYGPIEVIHGISLDVNEGECVALIGANGAGKSSTLKAICGLVPASGGTVTFDCSGTIALTAEIVVSANTTIDGSGPGGASSRPVVQIRPKRSADW